MNKQLVIISLAMLFVLAGCKGPKEVSGVTVKKPLPKYLLPAMNPPMVDSVQWFYGKAKVHYDDGMFSQGFTANIRMKKGEVIWASLTGPFGIEGGRVLITPDRIQILDRLNRQYIDKPFSFIENYVPLPLTISDFQALILGYGFVMPAGPAEADKQDDTVVLTQADYAFDSEVHFNPENYTVTNYRLKDKLENRVINFSFDAYQDLSGLAFSAKRDMSFTESNGLEKLLQADFTKVSVNEPQEFPFQINDKYEKIN